MSAVPPIADIEAVRHRSTVRFVPIATLAPSKNASLFDHLVSGGLHCQEG